MVRWAKEELTAGNESVFLEVLAPVLQAIAVPGGRPEGLKFVRVIARSTIRFRTEFIVPMSVLKGRGADGAVHVTLSTALMQFVDPNEALSMEDRIFAADILLATLDRGQMNMTTMQLQDILRRPIFRRPAIEEPPITTALLESIPAATSGLPAAASSATTVIPKQVERPRRQYSKLTQLHDHFLGSAVHEEVYRAAEALIAHPEDYTIANTFVRAYTRTKDRNDLKPLEMAFPMKHMSRAYPTSLPLTLLSANYFAVKRKHSEALEAYVNAYAMDDSQPLTCLCLAALLVFFSARATLQGRHEVANVPSPYSSLCYHHLDVDVFEGTGLPRAILGVAASSSAIQHCE